MVAIDSSSLLFKEKQKEEPLLDKSSRSMLNKRPKIIILRKIRKNKYKNSDDNLHFKKDFSPLSGSEQEYDPIKWNQDYEIRNAHNCYSYSLGKIVKKLKSKAQPGYASGFNHISSDFNCQSFKARLKKDAPGSYIEKFDNKCLPGFYKIFLALDIGNDYHWWRQDSNQYWSHKPGSTDVVNVDASGNLIKNPLLSDRKFKRRNYATPCFFACVYSDLARSMNNIYKNSL